MSSSSNPPNKDDRRKIARETRYLTPAMITVAGASTEVSPYPKLLSQLSPIPDGRKPEIKVQNKDSFTAARDILALNPSAKVGVLNMASERFPGGGWLAGSLAQEEALCFRSTLAGTLDRSLYPLPPLAALWSPNVAVFRGEVGEWCRIYHKDEIFNVGVVTLAALRCPQLTDDNEHFARQEDVTLVREKMRQVLRVLEKNQVTHCVLGALGCGAFQNPPGEVARIYKAILEEPEWAGVFQSIVFAVLDVKKGEGNFKIFQEELEK